MSEYSDFTLSWTPSKGKAIITAEHDGDAIHVDTIDPASAAARTKYATALAGIGCDAAQVESDLLAIATEFSNATAKPTTKKDEATAIDLLAMMDDAVVDEARGKLKSTNLIELIIDDIQTVGIAGEQHNVLLLYLVGTSRLLSRPVNLIVQGSSASGKSYLIERVSELFPAETKIVASAMTPQALHHMSPGALKNKFVVAGERSRMENDDRAEATRALREMLSGGKLSKLMPSKQGGEIVTELIEQEGPIAFVESTTLTDIFNEDLNRCILTHTDESEAQTRLIITGTTDVSEADRERVVMRHHAIQRLIRPLRVTIPYQRDLAALMPCDRVEARRLYPMLLAMIKASAMLHQYQREDIGGSTIEATADDYATAYELLRKPMAEALAGQVSDAVVSYFEWLKGADLPDVFCVSDIMNVSTNPKSESQTYEIVKKLHHANLLITRPGNHRGKHYAINDDPVTGDVLPTPTKLFSVSEPENRKTAKIAI